jgi:hypothetical protein
MLGNLAEETLALSARNETPEAKLRLFKEKLIVGMMALCFGCNSGKSTDGKGADICFDRDNMPEQVALHDPEEIVFEDLLNPAAFYVMYDTLVVVQNQPNCDHLIEMYSLTGRTPVGQFAQKGGGPDDFVSCTCFVPAGNDSVIYALDQDKETYSIINVPLTLSEKRLHISRRFRYSRELHPQTEIIPAGEAHYIGYNFWYVNSDKYSNKVPALKKYAIPKPDDYSGEQHQFTDYSHFVAEVNTARLALNPRTKQIWFFDGHQDRIDIYNDSLQVVRTISGPDHYRVSYDAVKSNIPVSYVTFSEGKAYRAYSGYTVTDKYIYVIYEGVNGVAFNPEDLQPVEVFRFDPEGNLVCSYKLDRFIYTVSVDSKDRYLYCTARTSAMDEAHFLRYRL